MEKAQVAVMVGLLEHECTFYSHDIVHRQANGVGYCHFHALIAKKGEK